MRTTIVSTHLRSVRPIVASPPTTYQVATICLGSRFELELVVDKTFSTGSNVVVFLEGATLPFRSYLNGISCDKHRIVRARRVAGIMSHGVAVHASDVDEYLEMQAMIHNTTCPFTYACVCRTLELDLSRQFDQTFSFAHIRDIDFTRPPSSRIRAGHRVSYHYDHSAKWELDVKPASMTDADWDKRRFRVFSRRRPADRGSKYLAMADKYNILAKLKPLHGDLVLHGRVGPNEHGLELDGVFSISAGAMLNTADFIKVARQLNIPIVR